MHYRRDWHHECTCCQIGLVLSAQETVNEVIDLIETSLYHAPYGITIDSLKFERARRGHISKETKAGKRSVFDQSTSNVQMQPFECANTIEKG